MKPFGFAAAALAALAIGSAAQAQPAPQPSPAQLEAARQLVKSMHAERMADQLITTMETSIAASMPQGVPEAQRDQIQEFQHDLFESMRPMMSSIFDSMSTIYAQDFTADQLAEMNRFYSSPTGQAVLEKLPQITQQIVPVVMKQMPDAIAAAFNKSCEKHACTDQQRAAIAKMVEAMKARAAAQPG